MIIDGRTRFGAAKEAGLTEVPVEDADLKGEPAVVYMLRAAISRRQLTSSQAAALAVEIEAELAKAAKERQRAAGGDRKSAKAKEPGSVPERIPEAVKDKGEARVEAARIANTNPRYVSDAKAVKAKAPELFERVKAGRDQQHRPMMRTRTANSTRAAGTRTPPRTAAWWSISSIEPTTRTRTATGTGFPPSRWNRRPR